MFFLFNGPHLSLLMLFKRHVYSSWYFRQVVAIVVAFSSPKCEASFFAMDSVERRVPYASNATTTVGFELGIMDEIGMNVYLALLCLSSCSTSRFRLQSSLSVGEGR